MCMVKKIANSIAKIFHKPIKQKVLVKFFSGDEFIDDYATEYYDVAKLALPIIKAKYMGN